MKRKALWSLAAILVLGLVLLVACGGGTTTPTTSTPTTPAPTTPAPTTPAPTTPAPTTPVASFPKIPHTLEGRADCLLCHKTGTAIAPKVSASPTAHAAFTADAVCTGCHQVGGGVKAIPASHTGRTVCLVCHKDGLAEATPKFPDNHASYTKETCQGCHKV